MVALSVGNQRTNLHPSFFLVSEFQSDDDINDDDDEVLKKMFGDIPIVDEKVCTHIRAVTNCCKHSQ